MRSLSLKGPCLQGGWSALHFAQEDDVLDVGKVLVKYGADPNIITKKVQQFLTSTTHIYYCCLCRVPHIAHTHWFLVCATNCNHGRINHRIHFIHCFVDSSIAGLK